jgi:hypothetical protein
MSNLNIVRQRRNEEVRILKTRLEYSEAHLNDGMQLGSLGLDYTKLMQNQRQAKLDSIETMKARLLSLKTWAVKR